MDGVNGFDGVFVKGEYNSAGEIVSIDEIIVAESKQFTGGSVQLSGASNSTGRPSQMTDEWGVYVADKLDASGKENLADFVKEALNDNKLTKVVTVVDRTGGQLEGGINIIKVE